MQITVRIDGRDQVISVADDSTPEEIDEIVNELGSAPEQRINAGTLAGVGTLLTRGATFGFGDEMSGAGDAVAEKIRGNKEPFGDIYERRRRVYDQVADEFMTDHPLLGGTAEATGAILPTVGAILAGAPQASPAGQQVIAQGGNALRRIGRAMGLGGAGGGLSGFGNADPGERTEGAGIGATIGTAFGAGAGGLVETLSPVASRLREPARRIISYVEDMISGPPAVPRAAAPVDVMPSAAQSKILQSLERDQITPAAVADRLRAQQQLGKPQGIVDAAGNNTSGLGRATVTLPGPGRQTAIEALNARADGQRSRVQQNVETGVRLPAVDTDALSRRIIEQRSTAARPAYQKAYAKGELDDPDLIDAIDENPALAQAHNKARALLANANKQVPELFNPETNQLIRYPTVEDIDLIKKGLDRRLYNNKRGANDADEPALDKYFASLLEGQRTRMLSATDRVAPEFGAARKQFAGTTAMSEALEAGQDFFNMDERHVTRLMSEMTEGEQEMLRTGAVDAIRRRLLTAADNAEYPNVVKSIFGYGKGAKRDLIATLFRTPDEMARFEAQMEAEILMHQTRQRVMGGSQTANKMADASDSAVPAEVIADAALDVAGNGLRSGAMRVGRSLVDNTVGRWQAGFREGTRSEIADELFNFTDAERSQQFLRELEQIRLQREVAMRARRTTSGLGGLLGGTTAGD